MNGLGAYSSITTHKEARSNSVFCEVIGEPIKRLAYLIGEPIKATGKRALRKALVPRLCSNTRAAGLSPVLCVEQSDWMP